jgi:hypothetical protein
MLIGGGALVVVAVAFGLLSKTGQATPVGSSAMAPSQESPSISASQLAVPANEGVSEPVGDATVSSRIPDQEEHQGDKPSDEEPATPPQEPTASSEGTWMVVLGSFTASESNKAESELARARQSGLTVRLVTASEYPGMRPGYTVLVEGPMSSSDAKRLVKERRSLVKDAYALNAYDQREQKPVAAVDTSADEQELRVKVAQWESDWENYRLEDFLSHYSSAAKIKTLTYNRSYDEFAKDQSEKFAKPGDLRITNDNVKVVINGDRAQVSFKNRYDRRGGLGKTYNSVSNQVWRLRKIEGRWLIYEDTCYPYRK